MIEQNRKSVLDSQETLARKTQEAKSDRDFAKAQVNYLNIKLDELQIALKRVKQEMEFMMKDMEHKDYAIAKGLSEIEELRSTKRALQETL